MPAAMLKMKLEPRHSNKQNRENRLILLSSMIKLSPPAMKDIAQILGDEPDWTYILQVGYRNSLLPLISWNLLRHFRDVIPDDISSRLSEFYRTHTQNNFYLTSKLIEVIKLLEREGIPALPFKGTTLALQAYENLSLRHYCDLDILVKPKHFDRAVNALSQNGFSPVTKISRLKRKFLFFTHKKDVVLNSSDNRVHIELHWKLSGSHFSMPLEISELWSRLEKINLGGTSVSVLPFNDLFVYLCLHGARHEWEKLSWVTDLLHLIDIKVNREERINWSSVRQHAQQLGCEKVVELGLFLVQKFYGVKTDYPEYEKIESNKAYAEIAMQVEKRTLSSEFVPSLKRDKYMYLLSLQEKKTHRLKLYLVYFTCYLQLLFTPNSEDRSVFNLPSLFFPLYYFLRPIRLMITYFNQSSFRKIRLKREKPIDRSG